VNPQLRFKTENEYYGSERATFEKTEYEKKCNIILQKKNFALKLNWD